MANAFTADLQRIRKVPFWSLVGDVHFATRELDGVLHIAQELRWCPVLSQMVERKEAVPKTTHVSWRTFMHAELCRYCGLSITYLNEVTRKHPLYPLAESYAYAAGVLERLGSSGEDTTIRTLQRRRQESEDMVEYLEALLSDSHDHPAQVRKDVECLLQRAVTIRGALDDQATTLAAREKLLSWIRVGLVPPGQDEDFLLDETPFLLDETPFLLGLAHHQGAALPEKVRAVLEMFSIRSGPVTVALVPGYVYAYTLRTEVARRSFPCTLQGVPFAGTAETLELAAALWDPLGAGMSASLVGALRAAEELTS